MKGTRRASSKWRQAVSLFGDLRRLEAMREAAKPAAYASLATKALRSGQLGAAVSALILLQSRYHAAGEPVRAQSVAARIRRLLPITEPANAALVDLARRLGVSNQMSPARQPKEVRGTLAHLILLAVYARLAKTRIRELQTIRARAASEGKYLEASLCDLFLISEFRKAGNKKSEKEAIANLKKLERDFGIRDDDGEPYSVSALS